MRGVTSMASLARAVASATYSSVTTPRLTISVSTGAAPPPRGVALPASLSPPQPASSITSAASPPVAAVNRAVERCRVVDMF